MIRRISGRLRTAGWLSLCIALSFTVGCKSFSRSTRASHSATVKEVFATPPRDYCSAPLWVWNDMLTSEQIVDTMRDLAGQNVKQVFVHPRPGLMTPYLSPEWFRLWKVALNEAERLDMNVWIYDENSYPSGFAGGWVPELMPESRGRGLILKESKTAPKWRSDTLGVFRIDGATVENVTASVKADRPLPEGRYVVAEVRRAGNSPWTANRCYVDLLYPGVTEKFLDVTLEAYRREIGEHFGKRVPGSFTDEPELRPAGGLPWTEDLPEKFEERWGYSLLDNLACLSVETGRWRKVRHDYFRTVLDLFVERWARVYYEYCEKHNIEFTGHYWEHEWPDCISVPDNMAMSAWQQRPGIDTLMNRYAEDTHAQFGNVRACREISSLANQLGRNRTLVELYGAGGWDLRFEDMKRIGDWLQVLGINTFDEHLSYITIRGARKRDHPQSFSYHEPWWEAYHVSAEYFARLSVALTHGRQINRILVLEPTTTAWMYQGNGARLNRIGDSFSKLLMALEAAQVEYDLGCEDTMARLGSADNGQLAIGGRSYPVVVVPSAVENLDGPTVRLLEKLIATGGTVFRLVDSPENVDLQWPAYVDGSTSQRSLNATNAPNCRTVTTDEAPGILSRFDVGDPFSIHRSADDRGILFHHRRCLDDGQILFLVNTSIEWPSAGTIESDAKGIEQWDPYTGRVAPYPFEKTQKGVKADFELPPSGSLLLFMAEKSLEPAPILTEPSMPVTPAGPMEVRRLQPNVLTLDYVDITAGGETQNDIYVYRANQFAFQKNGMDRNPWDSAVQFKDELITRTFAPDSGFTAVYKFTIEQAVPKNLTIVIERPDLYRITCNGQPITARPGQWWLDKAFGRIAVASAAKVGDNTVTIKAAPFTIYHELESAYLLGDFALKPSAKGFVIVPDTPLKILASKQDPAHEINPDGTMWLSGGIGYSAGVEDRAPFVIFDLGKAVDLTAMKIWNYSEAHVRDLTARGVRGLRVLGSSTGQSDSFNANLGDFSLARAVGNAIAETIKVQASGVRFVKFEILSNHHGVTYPTEGNPADNGFVGLAEVRFFAATDQAIPNVKVHRVSGELTSLGRTVGHLLDGSGLVGARRGWSEQGHPFYSAGVSYRRSFDVAEPQGRYILSLPSWYGSVARVNVNDEPAGYIVAPPWECDLTRQIRPGRNTIEVVVIGTLKNTLGPHHAGAGVGSAWPGMFQQGPQTGPPPGDNYHTLNYGLFEPFVLKHMVAK